MSPRSPRVGDRVVIDLRSARYAHCPGCGERWIIIGCIPVCPECGSEGLLGNAVDLAALREGLKPD